MVQDDEARKLGPVFAAAPELLAALDDLASYTGGSDAGAGHPCGRAHALLVKLGAR